MAAALALAMAVTVGVALLLDRLVFRRLRTRDADPLTLVFASFGLALLLRNLVQLAFGPDPHQYSSEARPISSGMTEKASAWMICWLRPNTYSSSATPTVTAIASASAAAMPQPNENGPGGAAPGTALITVTNSAA